LRIKTYIDRLANPGSRIAGIEFPLSPATVNQHKQSLTDDMSEFMLNNLRLVQAGVSDADFRSRFGRALMDVYGTGINELLQVGLLEQNGELIRLTTRGRLLGNQVFLRFV
jgi:oxygen-independent coproporphyrinogen-3 oxidase